LGKSLCRSSNLVLIRQQGWLFLVEGLLTVAAAIIAYFTITDSPDKAKWLTNEEQQILIERLKVSLISHP